MHHHHYIEAISLLAFFGLDATKFSSGLDKALAETKKKSPGLISNLIGGIKDTGLFKAIVSPIGAATTAAVGLFGMVIAKVNELKERASEIKLGAAQSNLTAQQYQPLLYAAQGSGTDPGAIAKGVLKIAEAQQKVKSGAEGSDKALQAFSDIGITLEDIKGKSYQELFLKIVDSMHVAQLTGAQLSAGVELMGKSFEGLEPMMKRGLSNPMDQMKVLTDEQLADIKNSTRAAMLWKEAWSGAMQTLAVGALKLTGGAAKLSVADDTEANAKRLQGILDARNAEKANHENSQEHMRLMDANNKTANEKKAGEINKQATEEERIAKLRAMPAPQRLAELQKETAELKAQASALEDKLKTEADAKSAPALAQARLQIAKNQAEMAGLTSGSHHSTDLTSNQKIGAFVASTSINAPSVANQQLSVAQSSDKHLARVANGVEALLAQAAENKARWGSGGTQFQ